MTYKEKRLAEFEDKLSGIFYSKPVNGAKCTENKQIVRAFLSESIHQAEQEMRKKVIEEIKTAPIPNEWEEQSIAEAKDYFIHLLTSLDTNPK